MNIIHIEEFEDGSAVATVADDEGNFVGYNYYDPTSHPRPVVSGEESLLRRFQDWLRS